MSRLNNIFASVHNIERIEGDAPHELDSGTWVRHVTIFIRQDNHDQEFELTLFADDKDSLAFRCGYKHA